MHPEDPNARFVPREWAPEFPAPSSPSPAGSLHEAEPGTPLEPGSSGVRFRVVEQPAQWSALERMEAKLDRILAYLEIAARSQAE